MYNLDSLRIDFGQYDLSKLLDEFRTQTHTSSIIRNVIYYCRPVILCNNNTDDEYNLKLLLNEVFKKHNMDLERIEIWYGDNDPELVSKILLHHIRNSNIVLTFYICQGDITAFFGAGFNDDKLNYDHINSNTLNIVQNHTIHLHRDTQNFIDDDNENRRDPDLIRTAIKNCSTFFSSWYMEECTDTDIEIILNGLASHDYIQSLRIIDGKASRRANDDTLVNSITNFVTCTKTLIDLELGFNFAPISVNTISNFVHALIESEPITDLSFQKTFFETYNEEILQKIFLLLERKTNIRKLKLNSFYFLSNGRYHFNAEIFSNLLLQNNKVKTNNHYYLQELDIEIPVRLSFRTEKTNLKEIFRFYALLKESSLEKLSIKFPVDGIQINDSIYEKLLIDTIPLMKQLRYFQIYLNYEMPSAGLQKTLVKSIGTCNMNLLKVKTAIQNLLSVENWEDSRIEKYINRNQELTAIIQSKTTLYPNYAWSRMFLIAKPTGPNASFHLLTKLGLSVGSEKVIENTTTTTTTTLSTSTTTAKIRHPKRKD